jgi:FkbM family methyltransferase
MTMDELLSEKVSVAQKREISEFSVRPGEKIVLFGAGYLGRKVLATMRVHGMEPLAFIDNDAKLHSTKIDGLQVISVEKGANEFGLEAIFVITIFRGVGDAGMASRERQLKEMGCRRVITFLPIAWRYATELLPHYGVTLPSKILEAAPQISMVNSIWSDAESRAIFREQLLWRIRGDFTGIRAPSTDQYFPKDLFELRPDEAFVDGGAYDGDTLRILGTNFAKAWAIEPNANTVSRIRANNDPRVTVIECALGHKADDTLFLVENGVSSTLNTRIGTRVRVDTLDHILAGQSPTFLKLDIEGAEYSALLGARELLHRTKPILAVCVYHRPDHLWNIPILLHERVPNHNLFLRAHQNDGYELVVYAVPIGRLR